MGSESVSLTVYNLVVLPQTSWLDNGKVLKSMLSKSETSSMCRIEWVGDSSVPSAVLWVGDSVGLYEPHSIGG